jgi:hypothetical protein
VAVCLFDRFGSGISKVVSSFPLTRRDLRREGRQGGGGGAGC